jgi:hypothetical protein
MTLDQIILYHRHGWAARETDYKVMWGILGEIMAGKEGDSARQHIPEGIAGLSEFKKAHPEGKTDNGAWKMTS